MGIPSGWDIHDAVYSEELLISNRANGYRDVLASIDLSTFRRIPWENNTPFFLVSFLDPDTKEPICADPRGVIKQVVDKAFRKGWQCIAGCEYEVWCLDTCHRIVAEFFRSTFNSKVSKSTSWTNGLSYWEFPLETPESVAEKKFTNLQPLTSGSKHEQLFAHNVSYDSQPPQCTATLCSELSWIMTITTTSLIEAYNSTYLWKDIVGTLLLCCMFISLIYTYTRFIRYRDGPWCLWNCSSIHLGSPHGR